MRKYLLLVFVLPIIHLQAQTDSERMDEVMQAATDLKTFHGVALIARHDSILLFKGYGLRDEEHAIPHDTSSVFQIGSVTKQFTATIILWLQEHQQLSIQDKLIKYFPKYVYADKITIKNLLTHTSGIPEFSDPYFLEHQADKPFSQKDFWDIVGEQGLHFDPGTEFEYSNSNYMLLGYIIEKVAGKPYEQMVREIIFDKAGMTHSGFDFAHLKSPFKSVGYEVVNETAHRRSNIEDSTASFSAGAIYTTAGDLYRWNLALYTNAIVSQAALEEAFTAGMGGYGYGWYVQSGPGYFSVAHAGGIWGFQSYIKRFPRDHSCIILLCNEILSFGDYATSLQRILYHEPGYYIPRKEIKLLPDSLMSFTGQFELIEKPEFKADIAVKDGHLMVTWTHLAPQEIFAEKKDFFHFRAYNSQLVFKRDEQGKVSGFSAVGTGSTYVYQRVKMP
jgi:CubicO group peptidase (beta-lactamase class C family)